VAAASSAVVARAAAHNLRSGVSGGANDLGLDWPGTSV
jgi:hypothetical protein